MLETVSTPKKGETTWLWLLKIITGALIFIILGIHFVVNHTLGTVEGGLLSYQDVVAYYQNPIIPIMEIAFLIFVVSHSLIGLRSIFLDLNPSPRALSTVNWLFSAVGIVSVVYGIWLVMTIVSRGS
jgi:succinate dehydrogenase / fumarate reductase membrane anchor subunit